jgi:hypothetical protein
MDLITAQAVAEKIESCLQNQRLNTLTAEQSRAVAPFLRRQSRHAFADEIRQRLSALQQEQLSGMHANRAITTARQMIP